MIILLLPQHSIEYTIQLANSLSKKNDVTILLWKNLAGNYLNIINKNIKLVFLNKPRTKSLKNFLLIYRTIRIINSINPDIVHIQNPFSWMCIGLPFLKKYFIVLTIHDPKPHLGVKKIHSRLTYLVAIHYADRIIIHGRRLKEIIIKEYHVPEDKLHIIPHGDFSFFKTLINDQFDEEENWILFFGRMEKYKGIEYLIKAEPLITERIPNATVIIAGTGPYLDKFKTILRNNNSFKLYDYFIPNEKVGELFQKSSVVVLPYIEGSQTGIIPIAYAFKKPVVATDVGSIPEIIENGKTGYVVPPRNIEKLSEAIVKILIDKQKRKIMGENGYKKMQEELSWDKIAEKTIDVYEEIE